MITDDEVLGLVAFVASPLSSAVPWIFDRHFAFALDRSRENAEH
jgi:hypothetical protein